MSVSTKISDLENAADEILAALTPTDRLTRTLHAHADGDAAMAMRLRNSTPKHVYRQRDADFVDRLDYANQMTVIFAAELNYLAHRIASLEITRENFADAAEEYKVVAGMSFIDGIAAAQERPAPKFFGGPNDEAISGIAHPEDFRPRLEAVQARADVAGKVFSDWLSEEIDKIATELQGCWQAFAEFCTTRLNVEPARIAAQMMPELSGVLDHWPATPTPEQVEKYRLLSAWDARFKNKGVL